MGINNITKFVKKLSPSSYTLSNLKDYDGKRFAIDVSVYLYQFKSASAPLPGLTMFRMNRFVDLFINFCLCLLRHKIKPLFIFDGPSPIEKKDEQSRRTNKRDLVKIKLTSLEKLYINIEKESLDELIEKYKLLTIKDRDGKITTSISTIPQFNKILTYKLHKLRNQMISVTPQDSNLIKSLLELLNLKYINAPGEADALCAYLQLHNYVDTVLSNDSDFIGYGVTSIVSNLNISSGEVTSINYKSILEDLKMNDCQFLDFCIMCGTDYNSNVYKVGPVKSYKLISDFKDIEGIIQSGKITEDDCKVLNHLRVREMYKLFPYIVDKNDLKVPCLDIDYNDINWNKLCNYLFTHNCMYDELTIKRELNIKRSKLI
jgi:5'-3' exonuclease